MKITLNPEQKDTLRNFAKILEKEGFRDEARFYHFTADDVLTVNAVILKDNNQFFIAVPAGFASLSNNRTLMIFHENGTFTAVNDVYLKQKNDIFWFFQVSEYADNLFEKILFADVREKDDPLSRLFNLTLLTAPDLIDTFSSSKINSRHDLLGSIVLGAELQPAGITAYVNGQITVMPIKDVLALCSLSQAVSSNEASLGGLTSAGQNFAKEIQEGNLNEASDFFSLDLVYRFGTAAYLFLKSSIKTQNLISRPDLRKTGLFPLRKALMTFFNEQTDENGSGQLNFRIVVSLADAPAQNNSIMTFSLNNSIISTGWRHHGKNWFLESLPLRAEDQLIPFSGLKGREVLSTSLIPFSGLTLGIGAAFFPLPKFPSAFLGYHYNLSRYLSLDFSLGYDILWYRHSYHISGAGDLSGNFDAGFTSLKTGLRLQYPLIIADKVFIMPFLGVYLGMGVLTQKSASSHSYFGELLINRVPVTLITGWNTGLEFGFRAGIPMALGVSFFYQQDFFGQQTLKKGPSGSSNLQGGADLYYICLYYKTALPVNTAQSK